MNIIRLYFFSEKEYITHLDNLIYMLHQLQKLEKYSKLNNDEFFKLFKTDLCKNELFGEVAKDILNIDKNFKSDLIFFIAANICFSGQVFNKFCTDLIWRL